MKENSPVSIPSLLGSLQFLKFSEFDKGIPIPHGVRKETFQFQKPVETEQSWKFDAERTT